MKYYIGEILEVNGDMEYSTQYVFATKKDPDKYTDKVALNWRNSDKSDWDEDHMAYWSGMSLIHDEGSKEIPREHYEVLKNYFAVINVV
jgi:hypothetical protein